MLDPQKSESSKFAPSPHGNGADGHMHEPTPGLNTGDVVCRICGVRLDRAHLDMTRGYGRVAGAVSGPTVITVDALPPERELNRKQRRAEASKKRRVRA